MKKDICSLINGQLVKTDEVLPVTNKYNGDIIGDLYVAGQKEVELAVSYSSNAFKDNPIPPYERYKILLRAAQITEERKMGIAKIMVNESGITMKDALGEIARTVQTFILSGEEAKRITGEELPIKANPGMENRIAFTMRVPAGVVCAITPFNAPFNTVVHKVAPAIAAGNTVVLKPSENTPLTALEIGSILFEAGLPVGHLNIVMGTGETGEYLLTNRKINYYTFTGSPRVGEHIKSKTGLRKVSLELGNNSATIVHEDANLDIAVPLIVKAAFRKAGQVCVSLQRVYAHHSIIEELGSRIAEEVKKLKVGDPSDPDTDVGPMISEKKAIEVEEWVNEAISQGAIAVTGGDRDNFIVQPTVLINAQQQMSVVCKEVFGPVLSILSYDKLEDAIDLVNDSPYGLQAGIFTNDINKAINVANELEVGGVNINETSNTRFVAMPYGGVKSSGIGREGPRYSIEEMTETKIVQINTLQP